METETRKLAAITLQRSTFNDVEWDWLMGALTNYAADVKFRRGRTPIMHVMTTTAKRLHPMHWSASPIQVINADSLANER